MSLEDFFEKPTGVPIISHSEVDAYNNCEQQHFYAHRDKGHDSSEAHGLEPAVLNERLRLGTMGHKGLEVYYSLRSAGMEHGKAATEAIDLCGSEYMDTDHDLFLKLIPILGNYFGQYADDTVLTRGIVAVEQTIYVPLFEGAAYFAFTPDLIVAEPGRAGVTLVDHKFLGRFYTPGKVQTMAQLPRYARGLTITGTPFYRACYNMVCTQPTKAMGPADEVQRHFFTPTLARVQNTWEDTEEVINRIIKDEENRNKPIRQFGTMKCGFCAFEPLCVAELNGQDTEVMRKYNYKSNTYGYENENAE